MRVGLIVACVTALGGVARADQAAPLEPISAARGTIAKVVEVKLGATTRIGLVEWRDLAEAVPPAQLPNWTQLVPFDPKTCARYFAIVEDPSAWKPGKLTTGLLVPGERAGGTAPTLPWCQVHHGYAGAAALPAIATLAHDEGDAVLPGLGQLLGFFGAATDTPFDSPVEEALRALDSDAALQFAIDRGWTWFAADHYAWRTDPAHFDVVDRALWTAAEPDAALVRLYWHLSPTRAALRTRAEVTKGTANALEVARAAPPWDEAITLQADLGFPGAPTTVAELMQIAAIVRAHPDDESKYLGARVRVVGPQDLGCDVTMPFAGIELRVDVDCDAENLHEMFAYRGGTITSTGVIDDIYDGGDYLQIQLGYGHASAGGVAAPSLAIDAGVAPDARPHKPRRRDSGGGSGCGCGAGGDSGLALVALIAWRLRRRRPR